MSTRLPGSLLWELPGPLCTELCPFRNPTPGEHQSFLALTPALSRSTKIRLIFQNSLLSLQLLSLLQRRNLTSIQSSPKMIHFVRDTEQLDAPREYYYPLSNAFAGCRTSRSAPPHPAVEFLFVVSSCFALFVYGRTRAGLAIDNAFSACHLQVELLRQAS